MLGGLKLWTCEVAETQSHLDKDNIEGSALVRMFTHLQRHRRASTQAGRQTCMQADIQKGG
eukprot:15475459-Alexandrium_andersonii.AAC.1